MPIGADEIALRRAGEDRRLWSLAVVAMLVVGTSATGVAVADPDLPGATANLQPFPSGSLVIPMDNTLQQSGGEFNLYAYGLANDLLWADIPVHWIIRAGKLKDEIDFSATARRVAPGSGGNGLRNFLAGPFIIHRDFATAALARVAAFGNNVRVFELTQDVVVDVRHTIVHRPYVAVLDDGDNADIHQDFLDEAGFNGTHYTTVNATDLTTINENSCYTFASEPHWDETPNSINDAAQAVRAFLTGGGNFLAECAAIETYENNVLFGRYQTTLGIFEDDDNEDHVYETPDLPLMQFEGLMADGGGTIADFSRVNPGTWQNSGFGQVTNVGAPGRNVVSTSKLAPGVGGLVHYLGGHNYDADGEEGNARRVYLNAVLTPAVRPPSCGLTVPARTISGRVLEDPDGDGQILDGQPVAGARVRIYSDLNNNGLIDGGDAFFSEAITDVLGQWSFQISEGLNGDKFLVAVDSRSIAPSAGVQVPFSVGDVWAEQTHGDDPATPALDLAPRFGGRDPNASDDVDALDTTPAANAYEHLARIDTSAGDVAGVDFAFSFRVITSVRDGDDDLSAPRSLQGSVRQFLQNAAAMPGSDLSRFVPAVATNATGASGNWWEVTGTSALPNLSDAGTILSGVAYDATDGVTVLDTNAAAAGQTTGPELVLAPFAGAPGLRLLAGTGIVEHLGVVNAVGGAAIVVDGGAASGAILRSLTVSGADTHGIQIVNDADLVEVRDSVVRANAGAGIDIALGDGAIVSGNEITLNGGAGVQVRGGSGNTISQNSTSLNTGLGIDLGADGVTLNDDTDADTGPNELINFSLLDHVGIDGAELVVSGLVGAGMTVELFLSDLDAGGFGEGATYLSTLVEGAVADLDPLVDSYGPGPVNGLLQGTDTASRFQFRIPVPVAVGLGSILTATGTDAAGNTSEFSGQVSVVAERIDLSLTKVVDNATPPVQSDVVFTITVSNLAGARDATGVEVQDSLPTGYAYVSDDGGGAYDDATGVWDVGSVAAGTSAVLQITATVLGAGDYTNAAEVTAADQPEQDDTFGDGAGNDYDEVTPVPVPALDLTLSKVVDDPTPAVGADVVFTVSVSNAVGFNDATSLVVTDLLPAGYAHVSDDSGGAYVPGTGVWTIGSLAAGATATLNITAAVLGSGPYDNAAEVTAADQVDPDETFGDGSGDDHDTASTTPVPTADLTLTKTVDVGTPDVGTDVVFTITLDNASGFSEATNVVVSDPLPAGYAYVSDDSGGSYVPGTGLWTLGSLAGGASATLNITATVLGAGPYDNAAEVAGADQPDADDTYGDGAGNDHDTASTTPNAVIDLSLVKNVDLPAPAVGATVVFTIDVSNAAGFSDASGLVVNDPLPAGYAHVSDDSGGAYVPGAGVWTIGNLAAGATATLNITATVLGSGSYGNTAEVVAADQPDAADTFNDGMGNDFDTASTTPVPTVDLSLTKTVDVPVPAVGSDVVFTVTVTNATNFSDATGLQVTDALPSGYAYVGDDSGGGYVPGTGVWNVGNLAAGAGATLNITATVLGSGDYTNVAEVTAAGQPDADDTYGDGAGADRDSATTTPSAVVDLSLTKSVDDGTPAVGSNVTFTITVSNAAGFSAATGVQVTDLLPSGYAYVSDDAGGAYVPGTGVWTVGGVPAGGNATLDIIATVVGSGGYDSSAEVAFADQPDADDTFGDGMGNDFDNEATSPTPVVDLSLSKSVDLATPPVGSDVVFTITVSNAAGFSDATAVQVSDLLPTGYAYVSDDSGGAYVAGSGLWTVGNLAAGANASLNITATVLGAGDYTNVAEVSAGQPDADDTFGDGAGNDRDSATTTPAAVVDLSLTKSVDIAAPPVGSDVVFTVIVSNAAGFSDATAVQVADLLPAGYAHVSDDSAGAYVPGTGVWSVGGIAAGSSATLNITATVLGTGPYANVAEVASAGEPDLDDTFGDGAGNDRDTAATTPTPVVDLSLTKNVDVAAPPVGSHVVFSIVVSNAANFSDAAGVVVTDLLPSGYSHVSDDGGGAYLPGTGLWTVGAIAAGTSATLNITAKVLGSGPYGNSAEVTGAAQPDLDDTFGDGAGNDHDTAATVPTAVIDLALGIVVDDPTPVVGSNVRFTTFVSNMSGFSDASGVTVDVPLPAGYAYVSDDSGGAYDSGSGVWAVGALGGGAVTNLEITARVLGSGPYLVAAEVAGADQPEFDDTYGDGAGNDYDTATTTPDAVVDLTLTKVVDNAVPSVGSDVVFTITVANAASYSDATGLQVTDLLPTGYLHVSDDGAGAYVPGTGIWTVGTLAAGANATLNVTATVIGTGLYGNSAEVTAADQPDADDTYGDGAGNDHDSASTVPVPTVDLSLTKTVDDATPGVAANVVFTITVSNAMNFSDATAVVVTDLLPSGYSHVSDDSAGAYDPGTGVWSVGNVAAGSSRVLNITAKVLGAGDYTNEAEVSSAGEPDADDTFGDGAGADHDTSTTVPSEVIDLALGIVVDDPTPAVGETVRFTTLVSNMGGFSDATGVTVDVPLPAGYSYQSDDSGGAYDSGTGVWSPGALAAGAATSLEITAKVLGSGGYLVAAEVSGADQSEFDDTFGDGAGNDFDTATTTPTPVIDLALALAVDDPTPPVAGTVRFTAYVSNMGGFSDATGVLVDVPLPTGYAHVSDDSAGAYDSVTGLWTLGDLGQGAVSALEITARVLGSGDYLLEAEVNAADQPEFDDTYGDGAGNDHDSVATTPTAVIDLSLTKSVDNLSPDVGTDVTFTITVSNAAGFSDAAGVQVVDQLPNGYAYVSDDSAGAYVAGTGQWTIGNLAAGANAVLNIVATVQGSGDYLNAAEVTAAAQPDFDDTFGDGAGDDHDTASAAPNAVLDLSLTKTVDNPTPGVGQTVDFTITVDNAGSFSDATGVVVTDLLPAGYAHVSDDSAGAYVPGTGIWSVGAIPAGTGRSLTITATVLGVGPYANAAEVSAADQPDADDTYGDGSGNDHDTATTVPTPVVDLTLTKTVDNGAPAVGANVVFTVTVANAAEFSDATGVVVGDLLPSGYSYLSDDSAGAYDPGTGVWSVGNIPAASSATLNITAKVLGAGDYTNTAEVASADQPDHDDTYGDGAGTDRDTASTTPSSVIDLALGIVVDDPTPAVGSNVRFTTFVSNMGGFSDASGVTVDVPLPAGYAYVSDDAGGAYDSGSGVWMLGALTGGGSANLEITARVLGAGPYVVAAEVAGADQPEFDDIFGDGAGNDHDTATTTPTAVIDLSLAKTVDNATPAVGSDVVFSIAVSNAAGFSPASGIQVGDLLPSGYAHVSDDSGGSYVVAAGVWSLGSLAAGSSATLNITATVLGAGGYGNTAEVIAADQPDHDDTFGDGAGSDHDTASTTPGAVVDLSLSKTVDIAVPPVGSNVVFTITVSNAAGYSDASAVVVSDLLPAGYRHVSDDSAGAYDPGTGVWNVGNVPAGSSATLDITATVLGAGDYTNVAEITAAGQPDVDDTYGDGAGDDHDTAATAPTPVIDLALGIVVDDPTPAVGSNVRFTTFVSNMGGYSDASGVTVDVPLPAGYVYVSDDAGGAYDSVSGLWTPGAVNGGAAVNLEITARVLGAGPYLVAAEVTGADQPEFDDTFGDGAGNDHDTATTTPTAVIDLALGLTVDEPTPDVGDPVRFTAVVSNMSGFSDATGVTVDMPLPSGYVFLSDDSAGAYDPGSGLWTLGNVAAGSAVSLEVTVQVQGGGPYLVAAEVTAADQPEFDDTFGDGAGNDFDTATTTPAAVVDLTMTKTVDDPTPAVGTDVVFTITVSNEAGFSAASGVQVSDLLPDGYAYVSDDSAGGYDPGTGVWAAGSVPAGGSATLNITATVLTAGNHANSAEVIAADQPDVDDVYGDGAGDDHDTAATAPTPVIDLALGIVVDDPTPPVGSNVRFTTFVSNMAGYSDASGVTVDVPLPAGYVYVSDDAGGAYDSASGLWTPAAVNGGEAVNLEITARVLGAGPYLVAAEVTAADQPEFDDTVGDGAGNDSDTATVTPAAVIDLSLGLIVDNPLPDVGTDVVFTLTVSNEAGFSDASGVAVNHALPAGYRHVSDDSGGSYDPGSGLWNVGVVTAGGSRSLLVSARVLGRGPYLDEAEVSAADQSDLDDTFLDGSGEDHATALTTPGAVVDLTLTKTVDVANPAVGTDVVFTISLTNDGDFSDASGVVVTDLLPSGYSWVSDDSAGAYDPGSGSWNTAVPAGGTVELRITARVLGSGDHVNSAEVTAADQPDTDDVYGDGAGDDFDSATASPVATADLSLTKTVDNPTPDVGANVTFTIIVSNAAGYSDASGVIVSDALASGYAWVSDDSAGAYDPLSGIWTAGAVPAGGSVALNITARVLGSGDHGNTAEVSAADQPDADDVYGDGAGDDFDSTSTTPNATIDLSLTKTVDNPSPLVGSTVVFTIGVSNAAGFSDATSVVVGDPLPSGYRWISDDSAGSYDAVGGLWSVGAVAAGATRTLNITALVLGGGNHSNAAEVTAADQPDSDDVFGDGAGNDHAIATPTPVPRVDLALAMTVDVPTPAVGSNVTFTLDLTNAVDFSEATAVIVRDLLPSGYAWVSDDSAGAFDPATGAWSAGNVPAGSSRSLQIVAQVLALGDHRNVAEVIAAGEVDIDDTYDDGSGEDFASALTTPSATIDLSLSKTVDNPTPPVGGNVTFSVVVSNAAGFSDASGVVVTDLLPTGYAYVSDTGAGSYDPVSGVWNVGTVAAGLSSTLDITAGVLGTGSYLNSAEVVAADQPDLNDIFGDGAGSDHDTASTVPSARIDLSLSLTVDNPTPSVGGQVAFTITVNNAAGYSDATNVLVGSPLPNGYAFVSEGAGGDGSFSGASGLWTVGDVPAGGSATIVVLAGVMGSGGYLTAAEVTAADQLDIDDTYGDGTGNDYDTALTTPQAVIDLSLTKTVDVPVPAVGGEVVFTLTLSNAGGFSDATGVQVSEQLPNGYSYVSDDSGGAYSPISGIWNAPIVPSGGSVVLNLTATVTAGGSYTNVAEVIAADDPDNDDTFGDGAGNDYASVATTPAFDAISMTKEASKDSVVVGDAVAYLLTLENVSATLLTGVTVEDRLPQGFKLVADSARIARAGLDGQLGTSDDVITHLAAAGGGTVTFGPFDIAPAERLQISYVLRVGSGALPGSYRNEATPMLGTVTVGATATADVEVALDPVFDLTTIIGKVFEDTNGNGIQEDGEPGVYQAMVALDDGTYALTDEYGRYHFPAVRPGQRLLKLNLQSLAPGTEATTDVLRVLWVTPGLIARANFGVLLPESASIGAPGATGIGLSARERPMPLEVVGSAEALALVVSGRSVSLPSGDVQLGVAELEERIKLVGGELAEPVRFTLLPGTDRAIAAWRLRVSDPQDREVWSHQGQGTPPAQLRWDGKNAAGKTISGGTIYTYQLEIENEDGTLFRSQRRLFGVDRHSVISLNLTGDAFVSGSAVLSVAAEAALEEVAAVLVDHPDERIVIEGHTDSVGNADYNLDLSRRRAQAAADYLQAVNNMPRERLILRWYGEERPVATNALAEGQAMNRRVEVHGDIERADQADLSRAYQTQPRVRINGSEIEVGRHGRFETTVVDPSVNEIVVDISGSEGRGASATVSIPSVQLALVDAPVVVPRGSSAHGCVPAPDTDRLTCVVEGKTEPGNRLRVDGQPVEVDADGAFALSLELDAGTNTIGVEALNPQGYERIVNVDIRVSDTGPDGQTLVIGKAIPAMTIRLPAEGLRLDTGTLPVHGFTEPGNTVSVNDQELEVQPDGRFAGVVELPIGPVTIVARVTDPDGNVGTIERNVEVKKHQLFLMAFADGIFGQIEADGRVDAAGLNNDDDFYVDGRLAFYLKGKISGKYLITAAYDSRRDGAEYLFRDLDIEQNERLLTNLDPDRYYPIYGDASEVVFDVQTSGKFYLALDSDTISAVIGNYPLALSDTELATYRRTLYGGRVAYQSTGRNRFGVPDTQAVVFTADVEQSHITDELSATGGSLYYLSHRDVIEGSEQVWLVIRDKNSGLVLRREQQRLNVDYTIKYPEGRVVFNRPVRSVSAGGSLVEQDILGGNPVSIEVDYETRERSLDKSATGGRVRQNIGDRVGVGITYVDDETQGGPYELTGLDAEVRINEHSRVVAEYAESEGADSIVFLSTDGGVTYSETAINGTQKGSAYKLGVDLDLGEFFGESGRYKLGAYVKETDSGFFSSGNFMDRDSRKTGLNASLALTDVDSLLIRYDRDEMSDGAPAAGVADESATASVQWERRKERWGLNVELFDTFAEDGVGATLRESTIGAARYWRQFTDKLLARLQHQQTFSGIDNNQTSAAVQYQFHPKLAAELEGTEGSLGSSAQAGLIFTTGETKLYLTERASDDRAGERMSTILGARSQIGPGSQVFSEYQLENTDQGDRVISLVGLQKQWDVFPGLRVMLGGESARIDSATENNDRWSLAAGLTYSNAKGLTLVTRNEVRRQDGTQRNEQLLTYTQVDYQFSTDFALLGKYRYSKTEDRDTSATEARFEERSIALAYRPVRTDRYNGLFRYTRLADRDPRSPARVLLNDRTMDVITLETAIQLTPRLEWLAKYAHRDQEERIGGGATAESSLLLVVQRLNFEFYKRWAVGGEFRILRESDGNDQRSGWLGEVSYRLQKHVRLGVGYNFTDFSDDEFSQNDYSVRGWYFRIQGLY